MDHYHIWCNLKAGVQDLEWCEAVGRYLDRLRDEERIAGYALARRKLGLGPGHLGEFHIRVDVQDLAQLDAAFTAASARAGAVEELHAAVNQFVTDLSFALYRDFPDPHRRTGEERF